LVLRAKACPFSEAPERERTEGEIEFLDDRKGTAMVFIDSEGGKYLLPGMTRGERGEVSRSRRKRRGCRVLPRKGERGG